jgi:hypothetical protein
VLQQLSIASVTTLHGDWIKDVPLKRLLLPVIPYQHIRFEFDTTFQPGMRSARFG